MKRTLHFLFLLSLFLGFQTGAWASGVDDLTSISENYTFIGQTAVGETLVDKTLYDSGKILSLGGSGYAENKGMSTINGKEYFNCFQIKNNRQIAFKVTAPCKLTLYNSVNSSRDMQVGSTSAGTDYGTSKESPHTYTISKAGVVYISASGDLYLAGFSLDFTPSTEPEASLSATSGTINIAKSWEPAVGSTKVSLAGANLTDGTYQVTGTDDATTISPDEFTVSGGSVSQEFTITISDASAASSTFTFGSSDMGVDAPTYALSYSNTQPDKRELEQASISDSYTWDWANAGSETIELTDKTSPKNGEEFLMATLPEIPNSTTFNSQALLVSCQFPVRGANSYLQGSVVKFNTTVPGTVKVTFSNTGSRTDEEALRRYLYVNGENTGTYSLNTTMVEATGVEVAAGEVVITAKMDGNPTMVRIGKIEFVASDTPGDTYTVTFEAGENGTSDETSLTEESAGAGVTLPGVTANEGFTFLGWYDAATGGNMIGSAGETYNPTANITLYAQYNDETQPATVSVESTAVNAFLGETTTLTVTVDGTPTPEVKWYRASAVDAFEDAVQVGTGAEFTPTIDVIGTYYFYAVASNGVGDDATTEMITLTVTLKTDFTIELKEGTEDADKWTITSSPAKKGDKVTLKYSGTKKVKKVTAEKKTSK